jgi:hypothetical protein
MMNIWKKKNLTTWWRRRWDHSIEKKKVYDKKKFYKHDDDVQVTRFDDDKMARHTRFHDNIKKKFVSDEMLDTRLNNSNPCEKFWHSTALQHTRTCAAQLHHITLRHSNMCYNNTTTTQHSLASSVSHDKYLHIDSITTSQQPVIKTLWQS